jgi:hypothetical protein
MPRLPLLILALAGALLSAAEAAAEPQILALLRSDGAVPLACAGGECRVDLSAFCMEPGRAGPPHESPYTLASGSLTLIATAADGAITRRDVSAEARFLSQRGYAAVRVSLPSSLAAELGAERLALEVGPRVALAPVPLKRHHRPHEPEEIAAALGANRVLGESLVDDGGEKADAARLLAHVINALPERGEAAAAIRRQAWRQALATAPERIGRAGRELASEGFERCEAKLGETPTMSFRHCLERSHDRTLWLLNHAYWKRVGPQT